MGNADEHFACRQVGPAAPTTSRSGDYRVRVKRSIVGRPGRESRRKSIGEARLCRLGFESLADRRCPVGDAVPVAEITDGCLDSLDDQLLT